MATTKKNTGRQTVGQLREENEKLHELLEHGVRCRVCGQMKSEFKFHMNMDPFCAAETTSVCKDCARKIALKVDKDGHEHEPDKDSVRLALRYLDKPFLDKVWNAAVKESENVASGKPRGNVWAAYCHLIAMQNYYGKTYADSDFYDENGLVHSQDEEDVEEVNKDVLSYFEQNREDVIRLLGYDPFVKEAASDQPFLYSSLIGYLDASEEANDDRMRVSSIIEIVKGFNHIEKINDMIAKLMADTNNITSNIPTIKGLEETKSKITTSVLGLAKDNGISLKHSVNASKGENTWTGKVRKLKEMNLREQETNLYDVEYSAGLQQVADISNSAIIKQIMLDENDAADMLVQQRELIQKYKKIADDAEEKARILLRENADLKETMEKLQDTTGGDD